LLVERVHVADAAEVFDSDATSRAFLIFIEPDGPIARLVGAPARVFVEFLHVIEDDEEVFETVRAHSLEQGEGLSAVGGAFAFRRIFLPVRDLEKAVVNQISCQHFAYLLFESREALQEVGQDAHKATKE